MIAFAPAAKLAASQGRGGIIHFEISSKNINKVISSDISIEGDLTHNLSYLLPHLPPNPPPRTEWFSQISSWKNQFPFTYLPSDPAKDELLKPQEVIQELDKLAENYGKENVLVSTGVGQHQMWAAQFYRWRQPRSMITSGGLGVSC
jgi:acetolactate synthase I/II/III large subunit